MPRSQTTFDTEQHNISLQVPITDHDPNEEEIDGYDEAICPCDMVRFRMEVK